MKSIVTLNIGLENNSMADTPQLWFRIYRMLEIWSSIAGRDIRDTYIRETVSVYEGNPERTLVVRFNSSGVTEQDACDISRRFADAMSQECVAWQMRRPHFDVKSGLTYQTGWTGDTYEFDPQYFEVYSDKIDG